MISATEFVCTMAGGSRSALFKCSDDRFYVVKFQGSPSHNQLLSARVLASKLARCVGLPVPEVEIIQVDQWLIDHSPEMSRITAMPCVADQSPEICWYALGIQRKRWGGLQLGCRYLVDPDQGKICDYFPEKMLSTVQNLNAFAGILVFDLWMNKMDKRKALFWRALSEKYYSVAFVDLREGLLPTHSCDRDRAFEPTKVGLYIHKAVYQHITDWHDFEPVLSKVEALDRGTIESIAAQVPECWYAGWHGMPALLKKLRERKTTVRDLLSSCLLANPEIFPNWGTKTSTGARKQARRCSDCDTTTASDRPRLSCL